MMDAFEPPKYLTSLIAAANEGAKSAQTGALAFTLVGLFLLATAFSTTDEDLLLEHTLSISQIGVQVPVVFSFAIAPTVFLFLHAYTLIRYDMLDANLPNSVPICRFQFHEKPIASALGSCSPTSNSCRFAPRPTDQACTADATGSWVG
jgi:hypothetical protein